MDAFTSDYAGDLRQHYRTVHWRLWNATSRQSAQAITPAPITTFSERMVVVPRPPVDEQRDAHARAHSNLFETLKKSKNRDADALRIRPSVDSVMRVTCAYFGVTRESLLAHDRQYPIACTRHLAIYLAWNLCNERPAKIARTFSRDNSSIYHAYEAAESLIENDKTLAASIEDLTQLLQVVACEKS